MSKINKTIAIKLLKSLNLPEDAAKLIAWIILLIHLKNKNSEDIPNKLLIEDLSNIKLLSFSSFSTNQKPYFSYNTYTNAIMYLLFLSVEK